MKRELIQNIKAFPWEDGKAIDRAGFLSAVVAVQAKSTGEVTLKVQHCDTEGGSYVDVPDPLLVVEGGPTVKDVQVDDLVNFDLDLIGCKQFVKIAFEGEAKGEGAAVVVLGDPAQAPVNGAGLGE